MDIPALWPSLTTPTRAWLINHNGEALSPAVVDELTVANGGTIDPSWWADDADDPTRLSDDAVDWIEAVANGEGPGSAD